MSTRKTDFLLKKSAQRTSAAQQQAERDCKAALAIKGDLFERQCYFVEDPFRWKSLLCPRRAGKTHTAISYSLVVALENPGCEVVICTLSLKNATKLYWAPLREFSEKYHLGADPKVGERVCYLPNGSKIMLCGAESLADIEKLRGGAYKLVVVDECKSLREAIFRELIHEVLMPATNDVSGTIALIGTPGKFLSGLFYEATCAGWQDEDGDLRTIDAYNPEPFWKNNPLYNGQPMIPNWSRHHWTVAENVFRPDIWKNALMVKQAQKWADDNPIWVREYLGRWVSTNDTMVYALSGIMRQDGPPEACRCTWRTEYGDGRNEHGLPLNEAGHDDWRYILGMDLGFEDDSAFVVMAYSPTNPVLYQVYEEKHPHLIVPMIVKVIQRIVERFGKIQSMVADMGAQGKMIVETVNKQYGYFIEPAEKSKKFDHIELLNSDLHEGRLRVLHGGQLFNEWMALQWDFRGLGRKGAIRTGRIKEDAKADNHLSDACLYTWRFAFHHFFKKVKQAPAYGSPQFFELQEQQEIEALHASARTSNTGFHKIEKPWTNQHYEKGPKFFNPYDQSQFKKLLGG